MNDYDMTIHTNPDARAWAEFFSKKYKVWSEDVTGNVQHIAALDLIIKYFGVES
jgi:hypothetical protein